ncbi:MAG: hypothetical protein K2N22_06415, partial [Clostridia bacterium]|nr:hypothetical protein [Clostridia bacterium]
MKKLLACVLASALALSLTAAIGCKTGKKPDKERTPLEINLSADGYVKDKIGDFSVYENTSSYRKVKTAEEFVDAISDAKCHYKNVWDDETGTYTQEPADGYTQDNFEGIVHVIEIENDLNLGYYKLSSEVKSGGLVSDFASKVNNLKDYLYLSDNFTENGVSQIKVENTSDLLIYSKNGAKLTHCGFKLTSDNNVVFRNLEFDEMWQWEDGNPSASKIGDYDWFGWAYFKIAFCGYIWIDHCTFGKSYDGQIDYSNPDYTANAGVAFRAPYGADGNNGLHISWCNFNAGSDDSDGYLYQMMQEIEEDYQAHKDAEAGYVSQHAYYDALRNKGASFEDILYGVAIPQKKGFLCGDSGNNKEDYEYNLKLQISFSNCKFTNLEDRLPKLRGGNACMYNCIVDSSQYYAYRTKLTGLGAKSIVTGVNSSWKCALVSQGIVCGNGGSFYGENCIYKGIEYLLKNNDSNSSPKVDGGYKLVNCSYQTGAESSAYVGSSSDAGNKFSNSSASILKTDYFKWHTEEEAQPFTVCATGLDELEDWLADTAYG